MIRYVLIGQKIEDRRIVSEDILGYFTDYAALYGEMESYDKGEYNKFFIGREERPKKLPPITDEELERIRSESKRID